MAFTFYAQRIFVTRFNAAVGFYSQALGLEPEFLDEDMGWAEFELGAAKIALELIDADTEEANDLVGRFVGVTLQVDDIQSAYEDMTQRGIEFVAAPEKQPWGGTLGHFKDLEGNILSIFSM
ncbi:VOC family protein [Neptuniibacter sp. QD48_55]|uniref:VOC family protein n=1 Tax=Neptuniibacter sp. QD48_55 TaxID=3398212 RepID=UPI0039F4D17C